MLAGRGIDPRTAGIAAQRATIAPPRFAYVNAK